MTMPKNLYLLRHGESEGNIAFRAMRKGDKQYMENEHFAAQHSSRWRLTDDGREQARMAGAWLRANVKDLTRFFSSEYARAIETAGVADLIHSTDPPEMWRISPYLRERNWGHLDRLKEEDRQDLYAQNLLDMDTTPYYWKPPNGEALCEVSARLRLFMDTLHRAYSEHNVIAVCHGEVIDSFRIELERMTEHDFMVVKKDLSQKVYNCSIIHYTRIDPETNEEQTYYTHKRIITVINDSIGEFQKIERQTYSSEDLLKIVEASPNFFNK